MKKIIIAMLTLSSLVFGFDMGSISGLVNTDKASEAATKKATESINSGDSTATTSIVDTDKAMAAVDKEKAQVAMAKGSDITAKDVQESVDNDKALEAVDKEKLMKALY